MTKVQKKKLRTIETEMDRIHLMIRRTSMEIRLIFLSQVLSNFEQLSGQSLFIKLRTHPLLMRDGIVIPFHDKRCRISIPCFQVMQCLALCLLPTGMNGEQFRSRIWLK